MEKYQLIIQLKRAEDQLRGIQKMIQEDRNSIDILLQIATIQNEIKNVAAAITENYTRSFVAAMKNKDEKKEAQELIQTMKQLEGN